MSLPLPADRHDVLVEKRPFNPPKKPEPVREWHTFEETGYIVLTTHRGAVLRRESQWTKYGLHDAVQNATVLAVAYRIPQAPTDLILWVFKRIRLFDRLYVGDMPNPSYYRGSDLPELVPHYEGYGRNFRVKELTVVHCSNPNLATSGDPVPPDLADSHYLTGD